MTTPPVPFIACCLMARAATGAAPPRVFHASTNPLSAADRQRMNLRSWHEGCPVPLDELVKIRLDYIGYDDAVHDGELVVHRRVAKEIIEIFHALFDTGFRIERMQPYEDFPVGADWFRATAARAVAWIPAFAGMTGDGDGAAFKGD